jgi:hypothetical protein
MENNNLKVFIYNNNGEKIEEKEYDLLDDTVNSVFEHNSINVDNLYNLFISDQFPPKDYVWDNLLKVWKDSNDDFLKIFIYDNNGQKVDELGYSQFLKAYIDVNKYNESNFYNQRFLYYGTLFPPIGYRWDDNKEDWTKIEEIKEQEIEQEEILEDQNSNILKIFVYNIRGEKMKEDFYSNFLETYEFVLNHNSINPNDPYNIYPGTQFPPKGYKWSNEKVDWVELTLYEQYVSGQLEIPNDCFVIENTIVRKNITHLYKEGLFNILPTQKIDEELNIVVDKTQQELIDEGILNWEDVYNYYYNEFKKKIDQHIDLYYFKYPKSVSFQFSHKVKIAKQWKNLTSEQKSFAKTFEFNEFILLISEFKDIKRQYTLDEVEKELDLLSDKIILKNEEIDSKLGLINNFFDNLYSEISEIKKQKNFLKLFDFVASIENRISQWIKS